MKRIRLFDCRAVRRGVAALVLLTVSVAANAYSFSAKNSDGVTIYYNCNFRNSTNKILDYCTLTYGGSSSYSALYSGTVVIPKTATCSGGTYKGTYNVTIIGDNAFFWCKELTSVTIPNSVTSIGEDAFCGCSGLTSVTIPNSVTEIGEDAFNYCYGLTSVTIGNSVAEIGDCAFSGCSGLTSVTIPNSVTSIGSYVFSSCYELTSITIGNSVTEIGRYAFMNCYGLTSVTIGNSVTEIGSLAFENCTGLTSIYSLNSEPPTCESSVRGRVFYNELTDTCTLYVPIGAKEAYSTADQWKNFNVIEERDFTDVYIYEKLMEEITDTEDLLVDTWYYSIKSDCADVAEEFKETYDAIYAEMGALREEALTALKAGELVEKAEQMDAEVEEMKVEIETMLADAKYAESNYLSSKLYEEMVAEVDATNEILTDAWTTITSEYPDMVDDLQATYDEIATEVGAVKTTLDEAYETSELTEDKVAELEEQLATIEQEIEDMLNYASQYTAVADITTDDNAEAVGHYTTDGKQVPTLQRGVNIIRYSDGTAKKVLVK